MSLQTLFLEFKAIVDFTYTPLAEWWKDSLSK